MAGKPVGTAYAELSLDSTPFESGLKKAYDRLVAGTTKMGDAYKVLGSKSAETFNQMRDNVIRASNSIQATIKGNSEEVLRVKRLEAEQLARIDEQQYGRQMSMIDTLRSHWLAASAAIASALLMIRKAWDLAGTAADFQERVAALDALGRAAGMSGRQIVDAMVTASRGLLSVSDAASVAAKALNLNLSAEQMIAFTRVAETLTDVIGGTIPEAFERMTVAAASGRTQTLAQMGIIVDLDSAYKRYADQIGVTVKQLTEEERQRVRINTILDAAKAKVDIFGDAIDSNRDKMDRAINTIKNLTLWVGEKLAWAFVSVIDTIAATNKKLEEQKKLVGEVTASFDAYAAGLQKIETPTVPPAHISGMLPDVSLSLVPGARVPKPPPQARPPDEEALKKAADALRKKNELLIKADQDAFAQMERDRVEFSQWEMKHIEDQEKWKLDRAKLYAVQDAKTIEEAMKVRAEFLQWETGLVEQELKNQEEQRALANQNRATSSIAIAEYEAQVMQEAADATMAYYQAIADRMKPIRDLFEDVFGGIADGITTAIRGVQQGTQTMEEAFRNMAQNIMLSIQEYIIRQGLMQLAKMLASSFSGGSGAAIGQALSSILSGISGYAEGGTVPGPIGRPQLAVVHGGETITPPGAAGQSVTINVDARGAQRGVSTEVMQAIQAGMGRAVQVSVARVQDLSRRGRMRGLDR